MIVLKIIVRIVNKINVAIFIWVGCCDHHEYSLIKYVNDQFIKKIKRNTKLLDSLKICSFVQFDS